MMNIQVIIEKYSIMALLKKKIMKDLKKKLKQEKKILKKIQDLITIRSIVGIMKIQSII